jgi:carbonic anhydrase/acetyltransferase-like protein (isoleucine patch superfamily)
MGNILPYDGVMPTFGRDVYIAPGAQIIGQVTIGDESSVWFNAVLRGDVGAIVIGKRSNVQDLSLVHMTGGVSDARIGADVTFGHYVTLHGCDIGDRCLIGMGSVLLDGVRVGDDCVIAAGTLLTPRMVIPAGSLVFGRPGKVIRAATAKEKQLGPDGAAHYFESARKYRAMEQAADIRAARGSPALRGESPRDDGAKREFVEAETVNRPPRSAQSRRRPPR